MSRALSMWFTLLLLAVPVAQAAELGPELWDRPRSAQAVLAQAELREAVAQLQLRSPARLLLRHAPGADAQAQAEELRAWLIALAVEPSRLVLRADAAVKGLRLEWIE